MSLGFPNPAPLAEFIEKHNLWSYLFTTSAIGVLTAAGRFYRWLLAVIENKAPEIYGAVCGAIIKIDKKTRRLERELSRPRKRSSSRRGSLRLLPPRALAPGPSSSDQRPDSVC